ncbi:hypothetical protein [Halorussus sp. MSC15.2]|uniref:hypothetical protein n=1 Tax=Halorussus sp. MSC15.2 TaxID=2283638 RepID=UPI0013D0CFDA|nr:hypothetical protein [Halorussus sp. MSC15.2]NEU58447.1 hypothetical protein [Halorussus sp. MSC15.2]
MSTDTPRLQESTGTVTGPHDGRNSDGELDHRYWRCERCGLETTDPRLREGCFRCAPATDLEGRTGERDEGVGETDGGADA